MRDKRFAASVDRSIILECEDIKIPIGEFAQISLDAMKGISDKLGL
jgi:predicted hydrolase (HD superfamily)